MLITKDRDDKSMGRRVEFPKLILEEENIDKAEADQQTEKTLSSREIVTFLLFCGLFIIAIYLQLSIEGSYAMNSALRSTISAMETNFLTITIEEDYLSWMEDFVDQLYKEKYYEGYPTDGLDEHTLPNLNTLMTPLRIT